MAHDDTASPPPLCAHALTAADALPDPATIAGCPVCWRRWRLAEARMRGWASLSAATARPLLDRMAAEAATGVEPDPALSRGFYAFLAGSPDDEADFAAACVVAFAPPGPAPPRRPRADFGWRALFADLPTSLPDRAPVVPTTLLTRVWQWRESGGSGTATRHETRAFVRGESPPPFMPLPSGSATRWVRERAAYDGDDSIEETTLRQQIVGPLALRLTGAGTDTPRLALRLRDGAGAETVAVRVYGGEGAGEPLWAGTLSFAAAEATIPLDRETSQAFTVEFDTAW